MNSKFYQDGARQVISPSEHQTSPQSDSPDDISQLLSKGPRPYTTTSFERTLSFFKPFLKYVFNIKPAIPNIIYVLISVGVMQLIRMEGYLPKIDWLEPVLFYGLLAGIAIQILFASAKTITIPLLTLLCSSWAIWALTTQGVSLPINKEIFQYMTALGVIGIIISVSFNP